MKLLLLLFIIPSVANSEIYPRGGENVNRNTQGGKMNISWAKDDFEGLIDIFIWNFHIGEFQPIYKEYDSDELSYQWKIPSYIKPGNYFRIKIRESNNPQKYLMSETYFSISGMSDDNNNEPFDNLILNDEISIFPHPIDDYTNISSNNYQMIYLKLYDSSGQIIYSTSETSINYYVSFDYVSSGQYIAEIGFENELKIIQKILVVK